MARAKDRILILDFGSQYTQLIARRVRELSVYCEIHPYDRTQEAIEAFEPQGIILSGGPSSVYDQDAPTPDPSVFEMGLPVLGICYGMQTMTEHFQGKIESSDHREFGRGEIKLTEKSALFSRLDFEKNHTVWMSHGDRLTNIPEGFDLIAESTNGIPAAIGHRSKPFFGVQFHPEVVHTPIGQELLSAFVLDLCGCEASWTMAAFVEETVEKIRAQVGDKRVICGLSGGVDSSVAAVLVHKAIGDRLECIFVDNGVLRKDEADQVEEMFGEDHKMNFTRVDARERFYSELAGVSDPETKRKIIGRVFIELFEKESKRWDDAAFLCQGTLYPDVIESVSFKGPSHTIKSHHNVGGLPERMEMELVEPLRELFKDEVRAVGREMGLDDEMVNRKPFPGPGLAVRILGEVTAERVHVLQEADAIVRKELSKEPFWGDIWQCFAALLPIQTVGVMGDQRTYEDVCAIRAVSSTDGMTADFYPIPHEVLGRISTRIINEVRGINRVCYDVSSKPPATIEWE